MNYTCKIISNNRIGSTNTMSVLYEFENGYSESVDIPNPSDDDQNISIQNRAATIINEQERIAKAKIKEVEIKELIGTVITGTV